MIYRSTILEWNQCKSGFPILTNAVIETDSIKPGLTYNGIKSTSQNWPTIACSMNDETCKSLGGAWLRHEDGNTTCNCVSGYYGVYRIHSNNKHRTLESCIPCLHGSTSIPGTHNIRGCYCSGGYANSSINGRRICVPCMQKHGNKKYCPGGLDDENRDDIRKYIYTSTVSNTYITLNSESCAVCNCPSYSETNIQIASQKKSCRPFRNMRLKTDTNAVELYELCDNSRYGNSSSITIWSDIGEQVILILSSSKVYYYLKFRPQNIYILDFYIDFFYTVYQAVPDTRCHIKYRWALSV